MKPPITDEDQQANPQNQHAHEKKNLTLTVGEFAAFSTEARLQLTEQLGEHLYEFHYDHHIVHIYMLYDFLVEIHLPKNERHSSVVQPCVREDIYFESGALAA